MHDEYVSRVANCDSKNRTFVCLDFQGMGGDPSQQSGQVRNGRSRGEKGKSCVFSDFTAFPRLEIASKPETNVTGRCQAIAHIDHWSNCVTAILPPQPF